MGTAQQEHNTKKYLVTLLGAVILITGAYITSLFTSHLPFVEKLQAAVATTCANSSLWNYTQGIRSDRLMDFSRAGYMAGEKEIPDDPAQLDVTDFGANGNDKRDDTTAFEQAIDAATGVIYIPEGEYMIRRPLRILKDNVVLRGAGKSKTILRFPRSLQEYCEIGSNISDDPTCAAEYKNDNEYPFKQNGGFIQFGPDTLSKFRGAPINRQVLEDAERGENTITISNTDGFEVGQWVVLQMQGDPNLSPEDSLMHEIQGGIPEGTDNSKIDDEQPRSLHKIVSIDNNTLTFALPLNTDVRPEWNSTVSRLETTVSNVGIEHLKILFPFTEYEGQYSVTGYNAIHFSSASNCWARGVEIHNADNAIQMNRTAFCTLNNIWLNDSIQYERLMINKNAVSEAKNLVKEIKKKKSDWDYDAPDEWLDKNIIRGEYSGHHGITVGKSYYTLVSNSHVKNRPSLSITVSSYANMNVFSNLEGLDFTIDHHRRAPHDNLFTEIETGAGTRVWKSGGVWRGFGPHSGAYNTYWNITRKNGSTFVPLPTDSTDFNASNIAQDFGLNLNFIFNTNQSSKRNANDSWLVEDRSRNLCAPNLYEAMVAQDADQRDNEPASIF